MAKTQKNIILAYRLCLKQLYKIKQKDQKLFHKILSSLKNNHHNMPINTKHTYQTLTSFTDLLTNTNNNEKKSIIKLIRIFTNNSNYITSQLQFQSDYQSTPLKHIKQDIEYQSLNEKQQNFVIQTLKKVCDRKPMLKYKSIAQYLNSGSSQNLDQEFKINNMNKQFKLNTYKNVLNQNSPYLWAYSQLFVNQNDKIGQMVNQIRSRKIYLV